jgi:hypothetical protein
MVKCLSGGYVTKTVDIEPVNNSIQAVVALTQNGDEVVVEENGEALVKVTRLSEGDMEARTLDLGTRTPGLGKGYWMSEDFDDKLPDEFSGVDKEL